MNTPLLPIALAGCVLLVSACNNNPTREPDLSQMQTNIDTAQAEDFGDFMRSMHKAGEQLATAEAIYRELQQRPQRNDSMEQVAKGEQAATQAVIHRTNAENAFERLLIPLETDIKVNSTRLDYLESLHVKADTQIPKPNVYFDFASSRFNADELVKVNEVIDFLRQYPVFAIKLVGYADTVGAKLSNVKLAENRNKSVVAMLRQQGLPLSTVVTVAVGEAEGPDETNNPENRRVEIKPYVHGKYVYAGQAE